MLREDGRWVADDPWRTVGDDEPLPDGPAVVSLGRLLADPEALLAHGPGLGVRIAPEDDTAALAPYLDRLALVAVEFPRFADGRGFSHARLLRQRHGFRGELRAIGDVLIDQLYFMRRVGFDAFDLRPDQDRERAATALRRYTVAYQGAADDTLPVWRGGRGR